MAKVTQRKYKSFTVNVKSYTDSQLGKDFKLAGSVMVCVLLILFHYVYIMKQLIDYPDMSYGKVATLFGLWGVNCCGTLYLLVYKVYPLIAGAADADRINKDQ